MMAVLPELQENSLPYPAKFCQRSLCEKSLAIRMCLLTDRLVIYDFDLVHAFGV